MSTNIKLLEWQSKVLKDKHRFKIINCGRRAGKSYLVSIELLRFASDNDNVDCWYISPTYKQSKAIMWEMLMDLIPQKIIHRSNEQNLVIELINGSKIFLKGGDDPDSLRGVKIDFCVFDETAFFDRWEEVWKVIRPTLIDSIAPVWFISTPNGFNHFKEMAENVNREGKPHFKAEDHEYFHYTSYANSYLSIDELEQMKNDMDEDSFAQEILGEFRRMSGLIYKDFNRDIHMVSIPTLSPNFTFTRSLDFGFGHKSALIYFAITLDGTIYAYDGVYQEGLTESQIADIVRIKDAGRYMTNPIADSAQAMNIAQLSELGCHFNPVTKGPDSVKHGIAKVAELLKIRKDTGKPGIMFNKDLVWIADEFEKYRWMENRSQGFIKEIPLKRDDDAMDAIRYFAMSYRDNIYEEDLPVENLFTNGFY
jgi:PBSX family phage terminase large subunit